MSKINLNSVPKSKVQLSNRAPETQLVLKKIKGWGINWGVTIVLGLFLVLLFGTFLFKFPRTELIQLKVESPSLVQVTPLASDLMVDEGVLELNGVSYTLYPDEKKGDDGYFTTKTAIALQPNSADQVRAQFTQDVNILSIIFKGLF